MQPTINHHPLSETPGTLAPSYTTPYVWVAVRGIDDCYESMGDIVAITRDPDFAWDEITRNSAYRNSHTVHLCTPETPYETPGDGAEDYGSTHWYIVPVEVQGGN